MLNIPRDLHQRHEVRFAQDEDGRRWLLMLIVATLASAGFTIFLIPLWLVPVAALMAYLAWRKLPTAGQMRIVLGPGEILVERREKNGSLTQTSLTRTTAGEFRVTRDTYGHVVRLALTDSEGRPVARFRPRLVPGPDGEDVGLDYLLGAYWPNERLSA